VWRVQCGVVRMGKAGDSEEERRWLILTHVGVGRDLEGWDEVELHHSRDVMWVPFN
jgi:hypothetical protein